MFVLQGMHAKPIFFARKFESIVSQQVVNMVDSTILGGSVPGDIVLYLFVVICTDVPLFLLNFLVLLDVKVAEYC